MVRIPSRFAVRAMRQAISPRLAIRTDANMPEGLASRRSNVPVRSPAITLSAPRRFAAAPRLAPFAAARPAAEALDAAQSDRAAPGLAPDAAALPRASARAPAERQAPAP